MDINTNDEGFLIHAQTIELGNKITAFSEARESQLPIAEYNLMINNFLNKNKDFLLNYYINQNQGKPNDDEIKILLYLKSKREVLELEEKLKNLLRQKLTEGGVSDNDKNLFENHLSQFTNRSENILKGNLVSVLFGKSGENNLFPLENCISNNLCKIPGRSNILQRNNLLFEANERFLSELNKREDASSMSYSHSKIEKNVRKITECPHVERKHYAKNMCYTCYQRKGRKKKAWECEHFNKSHYAKGLCRNCYHALYKRSALGLNEESKKKRRGIKRK